MIAHDYLILSEVDKSVLRVERVRALEADLWRAELNYEDALSDEERTSVAGDIQAFQARLEVHYRVLGITEKAEGNSG